MRIAFIGDSVTEGCFELTPREGGFDVVYDRENCYVSYLKQRLVETFPEKNIEVINAGISGNTTEQGLERLDRDVLIFNPDIVVICYGLNNGCSRDPQGFAQTLSAIFQKLNERKIQGVFMTPNMYNTYIHSEVLDCLQEMAADCAACQNSGDMDAVMQAGIDAALESGITVCDAYGVWKKLEEYGVDTTALLSNKLNHPTRKMHKLFADMLYPILVKEIENDYLK